MAYIRNVRTASGAVAVQVVAKRRGRVEVLEHLGSASTDAELMLLRRRAREVLQGEQLALEIEVPALEPGLADVADWTGRGGPKVSGIEHQGGTGSGKTVGTASRLLYEVIGTVFDSLGFDALRDGVFRDLVIARIVEPTSKRDAVRVLNDLGAKAPSYATIKRHLQAVIEEDYRAQIAQLCFAHAQASGDISLVLFDVTTLYFEAEDEDDLRKVGYSKERRVDPQIVVGLLVDRAGFPLEIGCFEGDKVETLTLIPIIEQFVDRHDLADFVVVADAGMLSQSNLKALDEAQLGFIVGSRMTKAPGDLATHFHWAGDAFTDGQIIETITPHRASAGSTRPRPVRTEPVWDPGTHPGHWRAIWAYSAKRAARDGRTLTLQENKARAVIDGEKPTRKPRFVSDRGGHLSLDEKALARARRLVGLKGYVCNIPAHQMPASEVIGSYHDLWNVEASFRMSKSDLAARPMFHRVRDSIEAHLTIVFTALAVAREMQRRSQQSIKAICNQLRPLRSATLIIGGHTQTFPPELNDQQKRLINDLTQQGH